MKTIDTLSLDIRDESGATTDEAVLYRTIPTGIGCDALQLQPVGDFHLKVIPWRPVNLAKVGAALKAVLSAPENDWRPNPGFWWYLHLKLDFGYVVARNLTPPPDPELTIARFAHHWDVMPGLRITPEVNAAIAEWMAGRPNLSVFGMAWSGSLEDARRLSA